MTEPIIGWSIVAGLSFAEGSGETGLPNLDLKPETKKAFLEQFKGMAPILGFPDLSTIYVAFELKRDLLEYEVRAYAHRFVAESAGRAGLEATEVSILDARRANDVQEEIVEMTIGQFTDEIDVFDSNPWGDEPV